MKRYRILTLIALVVTGALISACSPTPEAELPAGQVAEEQTAEPTEEPTEAPVGEPLPTPAATPAPYQGGGRTLPAIPERPNRLIIKDAELRLLVVDTDVAIDRVTQVVGDVGGYIISSRVWYQEWLGQSYKYATLTVAVPVDQFERAMRRTRDLALQVLDESAAGQDVTDEYVDLQSRLDNLEATRDRIRGFLDQAVNVEEALRVNAELAAVEDQIEQVQGRMNYLFDRAAYSTITVQLEPELPPVPTPSPTWSATQVVREAGHALGSVLRVLLEIVIWLGVVGVPLAGPPLLVAWGIGRAARRRKQ
jgi:hypothetical protein